MFDLETLKHAFVLTVVSWQAGLNMIPNIGWQQAFEAWSTTGIGK